MKDICFNSLEKHFTNFSYIDGYFPSNNDIELLSNFSEQPDKNKYPNLLRWLNHIKALSGSSFEKSNKNLEDIVNNFSNKIPTNTRKMSADAQATINDDSKRNHAKETRFILKTAKGTRDFNAAEMIVRRKVFEKISNVFKMHGAVEIETPVFELKEVLTGKYGEDSKLIYDLQDQGGEILSLRYDLTVPFARYCAMNGTKNIKRYHIARVYRRDNPSIARGRYREFYQCDFDIAGEFDAMIPDAECVHVMHQVLSNLDLGSFVIKINHRKILDGMFEICGVPSEKFRSICSAVDKLDKMSWEDVKKEMVTEKGLSEESADKIGKYVSLSGSVELLERLANDERLIKSPTALKGIQDLKLLNGYCESLGCNTSISYDMGLARGLDYYTGVIFEAILHETCSGSKEGTVGSVAGGGRYDNLIGMFSPKGKSIPCVGVSFGIERIFAIQTRKDKSTSKLRSSHTQVIVISPCKNFLSHRLRLVNRLHSIGIYAETKSRISPSFKAQMHDADEAGVPYVMIVGDDEIEKNIVKLKAMADRQEYIISMDNFDEEILRRLEGR